MPFIFSNKFQIPKHNARRKLSFHSENEPKPKDKPVVLQIGAETAKFVKGNWIPISGSSKEIFEEFEALKKNSQALQEENNLLKLKMAVLLDMLTEETLREKSKK